MTLLNDISQVHDGVLKAPPLHVYESGTGRIRENGEHIFKNARTVKTDHEDVYKKALIIAIEAVRIMQLASKNIEKEQKQNQANNHPIAAFRIENDKPVFAYVSREMSGLDDAEDVRKAKAELNRLEQKDEPDYVFEIGILLGAVRKQ